MQKRYCLGLLRIVLNLQIQLENISILTMLRLPTTLRTWYVFTFMQNVLSIIFFLVFSVCLKLFINFEIIFKYFLFLMLLIHFERERAGGGREREEDRESQEGSTLLALQHVGLEHMNHEIMTWTKT